MENNVLFYNSYYNKEDDIYNVMMYNVDTKEYTVYRQEKPTVPVYKLKPEYRTPEYYKETMHIDYLDEFKVSYKWRPFNISNILGRKDAFMTAVKAKKIRPEHIFLDRRIFGSDMFIEDMTIMKYMDSLGYDEVDGKKVYKDVPPIKNIKRGYYDIEVDVLNIENQKDFPFTCSTYLDDDTNTAEVFSIIRNDFKGLKEIMSNEDEFIAETKELIKKVINASTLKGKSRDILLPKFIEKLEKIKFKLNWRHTEKELIEDSWKVMIQDYKPMFLGAYNAQFDFGHTEIRAKENNINPADLFCHPDIGNKYYFNTFNQDPKAAKRRHDFNTESYTKLIDTQIVYFALRPQDSLERESLDAVTKHELGFGKLSFSHITDFIGRLPYLDYRTYLMYNIVDVIIMSFLDMKTDDINSLLNRRFGVRTEYARIFSPMSSVTNTFFHLCSRMGYKMANDVNKYLMTQNLSSQEIVEKLREVDTVIEATYASLVGREKIAGGLCSDPVKFKKELNNLIEGVENNKYMGATMDADATSMYPMIIDYTNVSKDSLDGRIESINEKENLVGDATISLIDKSTIRIGKSFFGLPDAVDLINIHYGEEITPEIKSPNDARNLKLSKEQIKIAEPIKRLLSKLDKTKVNQSDVKASMNSTTKHFHINGNESHMKINGSYYKIEFKPFDTFKFNSLSELFNLNEDEDGFIYSTKGEYFTVPYKYHKPKEVEINEVTKYQFKLDKDLISKLEENKLTFETIEYEDIKLDVTSRTHVFLNDDVDVMVQNDDTFIFKYEETIKNVGIFVFTITTKSLQY